MYLNGDAIGTRDARGKPVTDQHFLLFFNADGECEVTLPPAEYADAWDVLIDTGGVADDRGKCAAGTKLPLGERSTLVLRGHVVTQPEETDRSVAASLSAPGGTEPA
jgi:glycogen operon protein